MLGSLPRLIKLRTWRLSASWGPSGRHELRNFVSLIRTRPGKGFIDRCKGHVGQLTSHHWTSCTTKNHLVAKAWLCGDSHSPLLSFLFVCTRQFTFHSLLRDEDARIIPLSRSLVPDPLTVHISNAGSLLNAHLHSAFPVLRLQSWLLFDTFSAESAKMATAAPNARSPSTRRC